MSLHIKICYFTNSTLSWHNQWNILRNNKVVNITTNWRSNSSRNIVIAKQVSVTAYQERSYKCYITIKNKNKYINISLSYIFNINIIVSYITSTSIALSWPKNIACKALPIIIDKKSPIFNKIYFQKKKKKREMVIEKV